MEGARRTGGDAEGVIRHVVMFKFAEGTPPARIDDYERDLTDYVATLDGVRSYVIGRDAGINPNTYDFSIVAEFVDEDAFRRTSMATATSNPATDRRHDHRQSQHPIPARLKPAVGSEATPGG